MAYTYDDFVTAATNAGMMDQFGTGDLDMAKKYPEYGLSMVSLKRDLGNAKTNEQQLLANEAINQLRKNYGSYWTGDAGDRSYAASYGSKIDDTMDKIAGYGDYAGTYRDDIARTIGDIGSYKNYTGAYGSQIGDLLRQVGDYGEFRYSNQDNYKNLLDSIANRKEFSWDPETDELFSQYKKTYLREGDRAAANALAQAAGATGGNVSSYATQAAQQAANYYAGQLADAIPALRSQALGEYNSRTAQLLEALGVLNTDRANEYQTWGDRLTQLLSSLGALQGQDATDYARYLDTYARMQQNLQTLQGQDATDYSRWQNGLTQLQNVLADYQNQDKTDYSRYLDAINAEYQRDRDAVADAQQELQNAITIYQLTGTATGALKDLLEAAGIGTGDSGSGGGGGGGWGGSSAGGDDGTWDPKQQAADQVADQLKTIIGTEMQKAATQQTSGPSQQTVDNLTKQAVQAAQSRVGNNTSAQMAAAAGAKAAVSSALGKLKK